MPNQPKTPLKSFRIPQERYDKAMAKAKRQGRNLSAVMNEKMDEYIEEED